MTNIPQTLLDQLQHPNQNERSQAVFALDRLDTPDKLAVLVDALRSEPDLFVREDITHALMHIGEAALPPLIALLDDPSANVRHHAVHTLGKINHHGALDALLMRLHDDSAVVVRKTVMVLGQMKDARAVIPLVGILGHPNLEVQQTLLEVLESFGALAVPLLIEALKSGDADLCEQAADILGVIGDAAAIPALTVALTDDSPAVRAAAQTALRAIG